MTELLSESHYSAAVTDSFQRDEIQFPKLGSLFKKRKTGKVGFVHVGLILAAGCHLS